MCYDINKLKLTNCQKRKELITMKKILASLAAVVMIGATSMSAFAAISPTAKPENSEENNVSPNTGYSVMAEVGAIAAVVSCSAAGIVLSKKVK